MSAAEKHLRAVVVLGVLRERRVGARTSQLASLVRLSEIETRAALDLLRSGGLVWMSGGYWHAMPGGE